MGIHDMGLKVDLVPLYRYKMPCTKKRTVDFSDHNLPGLLSYIDVVLNAAV